LLAFVGATSEFLWPYLCLQFSCLLFWCLKLLNWGMRWILKF
jgi:hypothetical protein